MGADLPCDLDIMNMFTADEHRLSGVFGIILVRRCLNSAEGVNLFLAASLNFKVFKNLQMYFWIHNDFRY